MRVVPIIHARMSSRRLPGKVLMPLGSTTVLGMIVENMRHCSAGVSEPWVATSCDASDDPVEDFARRLAISVFRGSLDNVALRLLQAAESAEADAIVRINGDSPLLDPALVDRGVCLFQEDTSDLASNVVVRSFPKGQSVEVISRAALEKAVASMMRAEEREHVTTYFYEHRDMFDISSFVAERPRPDMQLSIDEQADLNLCAAILRDIGVPPWKAGWERCVVAADAYKSRQIRTIA